MSRTRLIRPQFFNDETMAGVPIPTRLVYIGLWTLCDDAGYFERKPRQISAELFPYDSLSKRQKVVDSALEDLARLGRIRYLDCGLHGVVPTLPKHGQKGGNRAETFLASHRSTCLSGQVRTGLSKSSSESVSVSESGSFSDSDSGRGGALADAARKTGGFVADMAARRNGHGLAEPDDLVEDPAWLGAKS